MRLAIVRDIIPRIKNNDGNSMKIFHHIGHFYRGYMQNFKLLIKISFDNCVFHRFDEDKMQTINYEKLLENSIFNKHNSMICKY